MLDYDYDYDYDDLVYYNENEVASHLFRVILIFIQMHSQTVAFVGDRILQLHPCSLAVTKTYYYSCFHRMFLNQKA